MRRSLPARIRFMPSKKFPKYSQAGSILERIFIFNISTLAANYPTFHPTPTYRTFNFFRCAGAYGCSRLGRKGGLPQALLKGGRLLAHYPWDGETAQIILVLSGALWPLVPFTPASQQGFSLSFLTIFVNLPAYPKLDSPFQKECRIWNTDFFNKTLYFEK